MHSKIVFLTRLNGNLRNPQLILNAAFYSQPHASRLYFCLLETGSPKPDVSWFREDAKLEEDDRTYIRYVEHTKKNWIKTNLNFFRISEDEKNTFAVILELNDVVETDAGLYKVNS